MNDLRGITSEQGDQSLAARGVAGAAEWHGRESTALSRRPLEVPFCGSSVSKAGSATPRILWRGSK
jgi:hypothetical protein